VPASRLVDAQSYINELLRQHSTAKFSNSGLPQNFVIFPGPESKYKAVHKLDWRRSEEGDELSAQELAQTVVIAVLVYSSPYKANSFTSCAHELTIPIHASNLAAAKAGTGVMLDVKARPWRVGWTAI
jgi:hypothetical protein